MTTAEIGVIKHDGTITSVYLNSDGYIRGAGEILAKNYTDPKKVMELIDLGKFGISYLGTEIGEKHKFGDPPDRSYTGFYGRDRGESYSGGVGHYTDLDQYRNEYETDYAYAFHLETKTWIAFRDRTAVTIPGAKKFTTNKYDQLFDEGKVLKFSTIYKRLLEEEEEDQTPTQQVQPEQKPEPPSEDPLISNIDQHWMDPESLKSDLTAWLIKIQSKDPQMARYVRNIIRNVLAKFRYEQPKQDQPVNSEGND